MKIGVILISLCTFLMSGCNESNSGSSGNSQSNVTSASSNINTNTIPTAPTNLVATALSNGQVSLAWSDQSNNELGFEIYQALNASFTIGVVLLDTTNPNVTTFTINNLNPGTTYYFKIRATNYAGNSAYTSVVNSTTTINPNSGLNPPSDLTVFSQSYTSISISWTDNSTNETAFVITYSTTPNFISINSQVVSPASAVGYTVSGLSEGITYYFKVAAMNANQTSAYSNVISSSTSIQGPSNLSVITANTTSSTIDLQWDNPNNSNFNGYLVKYFKTTDPNTIMTTSLINVSVVSGTTMKGTASGLNPLTSYVLKVAGTVNSSTSFYSNEVTETTHDYSASAAPSNLTAIALSSSSIKLAWLDNAIDETSYSLERATNNAFTSGFVTESLPANTSTNTVTGLNANTVYYFRVRAISTGFNGTEIFSNYSNTAFEKPVVFYALSKSMGDNHGCAIMNDSAKTVRCWGSNSLGQFGNNTTSSSTVPINSDSGIFNINTALYGNGVYSYSLLNFSLKYFGGNNLLPTNFNLPTSDTVRSFSASGTNICVIVSYVSGSTYYAIKCSSDPSAIFNTIAGTATLSTSTLRPVEVAVGNSHMCFRRANNTVSCSGYNNYGQVGNNSLATVYSPVSILPSGVTAYSIVARENFNCALIYTNLSGKYGVKCWGENTYGESGASSMNPSQNIPNDIQSLDVATVNSSQIGATKIALGKHHACVVLSNNTVKCWGRNDKGQLGNNNAFSIYAPQTVVTENGSGTLSSVYSISLGADHSCALQGNGNGGPVYCWGKNDFGQLGIGSSDLNIHSKPQLLRTGNVP